MELLLVFTIGKQFLVGKVLWTPTHCDFQVIEKWNIQHLRALHLSPKQGGRESMEVPLQEDHVVLSDTLVCFLCFIFSLVVML